MNISIIIPAYNIENYIDKCLQSVFSQEITEFEVICINDGSTDGTRAVIEKNALQHTNLRLINQVNGGLSDARNTGISHAIGKYIFFLDGDDFLIDTHSLNKVLETCIQRDADLCIFNALVDSKTKYLDNFPLSNDALSGEMMMDLFYSQCHTIIEPVWAQLFKRKFLNDNNLLFKKEIYHEDLLFTPQALLLSQKTLCLDIPIVDYQAHRSGAITSTTSIKHLIDKRNTAKELLLFFKSNNIKTAAPFHYVFNLYMEIIAAAFENNLPINNLILEEDLSIIKACASNANEKRLVRLLKASPMLMEQYRTGNLNPFLRKIINHLL